MIKNIENNLFNEKKYARKKAKIRKAKKQIKDDKKIIKKYHEYSNQHMKQHIIDSTDYMQ